MHADVCSPLTTLLYQQRKWSTNLESKWYRRGSRTLDRNGPSDKGGTQLPPTSTVSSIAGHHPYGRLTSPGPPHLRIYSLSKPQFASNYQVVLDSVHRTDEDGNLTWEDQHLDMIRKWATAAESLIHGRASGLDAAVCTYGGVASFKPGTRIQHLKRPSLCLAKRMNILPDLRVILVNSKVERNTSRMVQTVKERLKKFPEVVEGIFTSIDAISREAAKILHRPPEENGETLDKLENGGHGTSVSDNDHHSLQGFVAAEPIDGEAASGRNPHISLMKWVEQVENLDPNLTINDGIKGQAI
ncbi:hypothetical protein KIN20_022075 [Parelaphostrongylus tenuis]|uniref:Uncharacterized protein n=1 Tax=Parelaphostrongylus tenuis TaxID=148309 RepID=A0AAD5NBD9_PARTN|nr:hypothetical protein KIN20_022075 [Parelaphostrongylus tenuis]